jgi:hypothetical protein
MNASRPSCCFIRATNSSAIFFSFACIEACREICSMLPKALTNSIYQLGCLFSPSLCHRAGPSESLLTCRSFRVGRPGDYIQGPPHPDLNRAASHAATSSPSPKDCSNRPLHVREWCRGYFVASHTRLLMLMLLGPVDAPQQCASPSPLPAAFVSITLSLGVDRE